MKLTQKEKIENQKEAIRYLYCEKGESISGISRHLKLNRKELGLKIHEWNFKQKKIYKMTPHNKKWLSQNRDFIISQLNKDVTIVDIAKKLNITEARLGYFIRVDKKMKKANDERKQRIKELANQRKRKLQESHDFIPIKGEEWKSVLGYEGYYVSNMGRVKKYIATAKDYKLLTPKPNSRNGRVYVGLSDKNNKKHNLNLARLVGFAFCEGHSEEKNTIDYIDNDVSNNKASNLQWCSQGKNNKKAYFRGRGKARRNYSISRKITIDDKYEFKTVKAAAKFLNKSEIQVRRYLSHECKCEGHTIIEEIEKK